MDVSSSERFVEEIYFLIVKFLETGPCKQSYQKLKEELIEHKIIPKRLDWEGSEHEQTFEELENKYPHIASTHLLEICKRIEILLNNSKSSCSSGVKTLLGAGCLSLLRNRDAVKKHLRLSEFIVRLHGRSLYSPITCHNHNIVQVLYGKEISGPPSRRHILTPKFYNRTHLLNRTLGHLSAVYCLLFDQTGKFVITGADDLLIKVWSTVDGRLLHTLRGASAEITDIAISVDNSLLAAGSLDKVLRVWCLQTAYPVAALTAHTGMITGVSFCPQSYQGCHYLISTSTDGSIAFWSYTTNPVIFQKQPVYYNEKMRPGGAQMICSHFSYGGAFLASGSADHHVRVYSMLTHPPSRIMEMEKHSDRVDSLLWANRGLKFMSGSKDGTAIIWQYRAQHWHTKVLDMATTLPGSALSEEESKLKLKVTMVCWSCDDSFAITAVNNFTIKIWTSSGTLYRELTSHKDVVYVLEYNPTDPSVLLTAGHDGIIFLWDIRTGEELFIHQNHIEGQGNGAIFDAKWSPDGTMMAATDSHGHIILFGLAEYNDKMKSLPKELFFHTDYRPLTRDSQNIVLDEQTQTPPHLMPPPFLVDVDGNPYPPHLQRLVPGREHCSVDQLIPNIIYTPGGEPEVVQFINDARSHIDQRIEELAQQVNPLDAPARNDISPRTRVVRRGDRDGLRQSLINRDLDSFSWKKKTLIPPIRGGALESLSSRINFLSKLAIDEYETEQKREPVLVVENRSTSSKKPKRKLLHNYRTRSARDTLGSQIHEVDGSETAVTDGNSSDVTGLSDLGSSSSESSSTEYSDWVADHSVNLEPPQRSRRQRKTRPRPHVVDSPSPPPPEVPASCTPSPSVSSTKKEPVLPPPDIVEIPEQYRPSEWLSEVIPKKFPYYPQMGDEIMFFTQGYELYLRAVSDRKFYVLSKSQLCPWGKLVLREPELVKIIGIKYELRPPRLCCLRLAVMKENGVLTGDRFTIKYHDIPDVIDFIVLKQTYDTAMTRNWKIGDRFRSMIDDSWWWGSIEGRRPQADSAFLCHRIRWDNGEVEDMSPWDMEPINSLREPAEQGGSVSVLPEEIAAILYHPREDEWPGGDRESYCRQAVYGLEEVMGLSIAEPFSAPVDINIYKSYALVVAYPIDLSTIKARLENRFYRRVTAVQYDIRCIATNAEKFNEPHSVIVRNARIITDLCLKICKEPGLLDISQQYRQLLEAYESSGSEDHACGPSVSKRERAAANRSLRAMRRANHLQPDWQRDCRQLLEVLWSCQDSIPFRGPVDRLEHPHYHKVVTTPIDLGQIREELKGNNYSSPIEFCKDIRLMFSNSRQYNTNKRSKIYVMTVRLSALAEEHMKRIIKDWKTSCRKLDKIKSTGSIKKHRKPINKEDSGESVSEGSSVEDPPYNLYGRSINETKRIKVLLPKTSGNSYPTTDIRSTSNQARPLRLRIPIANKLIHNTESTDSSSLPSSSSFGHRNLRSSKVVSYAENCGEDSSQSPLEDQEDRRKQPYNMRSSRSASQIIFPPSYKEESSSENENKPGACVSKSDSSSEAATEKPPETINIEIHVNGNSRLSLSSDYNYNRASKESQGSTDEISHGSTNQIEKKTDRKVTSKSKTSQSRQKTPWRKVQENDDSGEEDDFAMRRGETSRQQYQLRKRSKYKKFFLEEEEKDVQPSGRKVDMNYRPYQEEDENSSEEYVESAKEEELLRHSRRKRKNSSYSDSSSACRPRRRQKSQRKRHPLKRPNYTYDTDSETDLEEESRANSSSDSSEDKPKISISSRGRVRKINPRARPYLMD